jgi:dihydroorotase
MIARAQYTNITISADVHAHQLHMTEHDVGTFDANYHTSPPLRSVNDKEALIAGVAAGTIAVSSGHEPHEKEAKQAPFPATESGISSLETVLPLMRQLVNEKLLNWGRVVERLACDPAKILGIESASLSNQATANITIVDPSASWVVGDGAWLSNGLNTPFWGQEMIGQVTHTLVNGKLVFER